MKQLSQKIYTYNPSQTPSKANSVKLWDTSPLADYQSRDDNVFVIDGHILISTELVGILAGTPFGYIPQAKIGRKNLYDLELIFDELVEKNNYPTRNTVEQKVRARNLEIIEHLITLS